MGEFLEGPGRQPPANLLEGPGPGDALGRERGRRQSRVLVHAPEMRDRVIANEEIHGPGARDQRRGQARAVDLGHPGRERGGGDQEQKRRPRQGERPALGPGLPGHPGRGQGEEDNARFLGERGEREQRARPRHPPPGKGSPAGDQPRQGAGDPEQEEGLAPEEMAEGDEIRVEGHAQGPEQTGPDPAPGPAEPVGGQHRQARGQHVDQARRRHRNAADLEGAGVERDGPGRPAAAIDARRAEDPARRPGKILGFVPGQGGVEAQPEGQPTQGESPQQDQPEADRRLAGRPLEAFRLRQPLRSHPASMPGAAIAPLRPSVGASTGPRNASWGVMGAPGQGLWVCDRCQQRRGLKTKMGAGQFARPPSH